MAALTLTRMCGAKQTPPLFVLVAQNAITNAPESSRPSVFVSSSAVGYYGASQTASFTEESPAGGDYLAEICAEWEAAAKNVPSSTRVVILRTGIVLARDGGVLARMLPIFELFAGEQQTSLVSLSCLHVHNPAWCFVDWRVRFWVLRC